MCENIATQTKEIHEESVAKALNVLRQCQRMSTTTRRWRLRGRIVWRRGEESRYGCSLVRRKGNSFQINAFASSVLDDPGCSAEYQSYSTEHIVLFFVPLNLACWFVVECRLLKARHLTAFDCPQSPTSLWSFQSLTSNSRHTVVR